ncbi:zinc ribbon domain-containing protein [Ruminococcus sp.]|uniref:zinc ribbon domain-containing protein n=1 Tax=Ruminococcus sp. TaxID=41978 RepID=UPI002E771BDF|nr:zinc ribbon domain-containing protein [Ruminococcus sp.]MEE0836533.1 zinc ribbon domain-containing protein [Ruminococcus sp.]
MRTCPHCGSELHDDSTFCFACMSIVNERKEILIKVNTSRKRAIPMVCVAVAIIAASSVFAVVSKKNNAVETKTPEPAKAVTTSDTVTTMPQTTTAATTTVPTTTTAPAPTADEIDKISGGIRQASTGTAGTTTTTTTLPEETQPEEQNDYQPNEAQQEENTAPAEPEPSYFSEDGANELSRISADKINKKREGRGYAPLRVCGQLDDLLSMSLETLTHVQSEGEIDTCYEITLDKLKSNLSDVGLPSDSEFIRISYVMNCCKSYDEIFEYAKKVNFSNELFTDEEGVLTVYSQRLDYKYLGCIIYDRCDSQQKPNGDISYTTEYVCEIWLMK